MWFSLSKADNTCSIKGWLWGREDRRSSASPKVLDACRSIICNGYLGVLLPSRTRHSLPQLSGLRAAGGSQPSSSLGTALDQREQPHWRIMSPPWRQTTRNGQSLCERTRKPVPLPPFGITTATPGTGQSLLQVHQSFTSSSAQSWFPRSLTGLFPRVLFSKVPARQMCLCVFSGVSLQPKTHKGMYMNREERRDMLLKCNEKAKCQTQEFSTNLGFLESSRPLGQADNHARPSTSVCYRILRETKPLSKSPLCRGKWALLNPGLRS